jgi:YHS domain-containing protein
MAATASDDLSRRLDAVRDEARARVKGFQDQAEATHQEIRERFQKFLPVAARIVAIAREKLEKLKERLNFDVIGSELETDRLYSRTATLHVKSVLAGVIRVTFRLSHDSDVRLILLDYDLEIIPIFFRYNPHSRLELPLAAFDEEAVGRWLDDRIVEFANAYMEMHSTKQYQERAMVSDPIAGISFPKYFAATTLEQDGKTFYFVSDETRREFVERHGLKA